MKCQVTIEIDTGLTQNAIKQMMEDTWPHSEVVDVTRVDESTSLPQTREEILEEILEGERHPIDDATDKAVEGLDWVSFYHDAKDGGHIAINYNLQDVETWDGEEDLPNTVYPNDE